MFDLFRSRDKAVRYLLSALLMLVALSMVTYLIPGSGYGSGGSADNVLAKIGDDKISVREVQMRLQTAVRNKQFPPDMMQYYAPQMVDQLITERAVQYQAERMGFRASDTDTVEAIRREVPQLFPNGGFVGKDVYAGVLSQQNLSIPEFEHMIKNQILLNRMRSMALESLVVSNLDVEQEFQKRNEKAVAEYVKLPTQKIQSEAQVSSDEIRQHFEKNRASYQTPEKRGLLLVVVDPRVLEQSVVVGEDRARKIYEQNKDNYRTGERAHVRHILLNTADKPKEEVDKIQKKAEALLKQIQGGADFADLAAKNSDDPDSKVKGGDLGFIERGRTVAEFEASAFSLKPKEISNLVKTQYGFHILQTLEKQEARLRPFEEVKAQLTGELRKQAVADKVQTTLDQALSEVKKNPQEAEQIAKRLNLITTPVEKASSGDPIPHLGVNRDFQEFLTSAKKGEVSQPVQAPGNKTVMGIVREIFPAHPAAFEEVQGQIRMTLMTGKATKLLEQRAKDLLEKAKALGGDLKKAAQSMGMEAATSAAVTRNGAIEGLGSASSVPDLFAKPAGALWGPLQVGDARVVGKVVSRIPADLGELAAQRDSIRQEIKQQRARERNALFEDGIRQQLEKEGKLKINQDVLKRLLAGYRS